MDIDKFLIEFQKTWDRKHNMKELINTLQNKKFMKKANNKIRTNKFSQPRGASKKYYYFKDYYKPKKKYSSRLPRKYGSREEVWIGEALMTRGMLKKADLLEKNGKIISKKISETSSKNHSS